MAIEDIENEIIEEFELFGDDWDEKYRHLIGIGKSLPLIKPEYKTESHVIVGCQSLAWLHSEKINDKIVYTADSESAITKGMIALMIRVLSNQKAEDILKAKLEFINTIGLQEHLAMTRGNGLVSMIKQMKMDAFVLGKI